MPIVASMGGNAATQTLTVTVRLIATKSLTSENLFKIINKEFFVGFFNGILFSFITGLFVYFWFYDYTKYLPVSATLDLRVLCGYKLKVLVNINKYLRRSRHIYKYVQI